MPTRPKHDGERYLVARFADEGRELSCLTSAQLSQRTESATKGEYRLSPIFPVSPGEARVPAHDDSFFVGFFFFEEPFPIIGELLSIVPREHQSGLWFSHGLASIIFFTEKVINFAPLKNVAKASLRAFEIWDVKAGKISPHDHWLAPYYAFNNGFGFIDSTGSQVFSNDTKTVIESSGKPSISVEETKAFYQKLMEDFEKR